MKKILNYIPGFRSRAIWKMIIASLYYLFALLMLVGGVGAFLYFLSVPFVVFNFISFVKNRKNHEKFKIALGSFLVPLIIMIFSSKAFYKPGNELNNNLKQEVKNESNQNAPQNQPSTPNSNKSDVSNKQQSSQTAPNTNGEKYDTVKVVRHIDGDTVEVQFGNGAKEKVRFIGINTPESTTTHEPYGEESSNFTKSQILNKTIYLEKDVSDRDKYGRLLRYIWLEVPSANSEYEIRAKMFNAILVLQGYAQAATYPPDVKYSEYFVKFQSEARNANKGLWGINPSSSSSQTSPSNKDTSSTKEGVWIKGNINSSGEKIYHVPGGAYYDKTIPEEWFRTEDEAKAAGYRKSKR